MTSERELEYDIELDHTEWLPVPLDYPWNGYEDAESWASEVAESIGREVGAPTDVVDAIRDAARTVSTVEGPFPGAIERFWFAGAPDDLLVVAHLYVAEYPEHGEAALRAVATAGIGGYVQVYEPLEGAPFAEAAKTVVLARPDDAEDGAVVVARMIGLVRGFVFIVEVVDDDRASLAVVADPLERLFRSIRLRDADAGQS